jgi:hypothetical protein
MPESSLPGRRTTYSGARPERSRWDANGSTDRLTDSAQSALVSYLYRAFGEQSVLSGSATNPFTWVGRLGYYRQVDTSDSGRGPAYRRKRTWRLTIKASDVPSPGVGPV